MQQDLRLFLRIRSLSLYGGLVQVISLNGFFTITCEFVGDDKSKPGRTDLRTKNGVMVTDLDGSVVLAGMGEECDGISNKRDVILVISIWGQYQPYRSSSNTTHRILSTSHCKRP